MKTAVAYYVGAGPTLERQKRAVHEYALKHRMTIAREFWDSSDKSFADRTGFAACLASVFGGNQAGGSVIVESCSRLAPDTVTQDAVCALFQRHDISLVTVKDRQSKPSRAIEATLDAANVFQRYAKLVRLRVGRDRRSAELGYRVEGNIEWKRFPAEHVAAARSLKAAGPSQSLRQISKGLVQKGYLNTSGKPYGPESVKRMLRDG